MPGNNDAHQNRLLDSMGEGEHGTVRESSTETCVSPYVKERTSASSRHEAGTLGQPAVGVGREGQVEVQRSGSSLRLGH